MHFAVLGLGDTNYDKFCYMGKSMDTRLGEVGGRRVCKVGMADEAMGSEGTVEPWIDALYPALLKALGMEGQAAAAAGEASASTTPTINGTTAPAAPAAGVEVPTVVAAATAVAAAAPVVPLANGKKENMEKAAAAPKEDAATAAVTATVAAKLTLEEEGVHQNSAEKATPQVKVRGGPLTKESGARWLADMVSPEEFARMQSEAKEALKATPLLPYAPSVKVVLSNEEEEKAAAAAVATANGTMAVPPLATPLPVAASPSSFPLALASVPPTPLTQFPTATSSNGKPPSPLQVKTTSPRRPSLPPPLPAPAPASALAPAPFPAASPP